MQFARYFLLFFLFTIGFLLILPQKTQALTLINDCAELQAMKNDLDEDYELGNDIDCDVSPYNTGNGFEPIGDNATPFEGTFDGKGYTISGLYINRISTSSVGLFGEAVNATFTNLRLVDVNLTGRIRTGALMGRGTTVTIDTVSSTGTVTCLVAAGSTTNYGGGIAGTLWSGSQLSNSFSTVTVSTSISGGGSMAVSGGLVGSFVGTISNSYSSGTTSATGPSAEAGGLVGQVTSSTIRNSFSTSNVSATTEGGGLAATAGLSTITNSYSVGTPFIGNDSGNTLNGGSTGGVTLSAFYESDPLHAVYRGTPSWDFDDIWAFESSSSLPVFFTPAPAPTPTPTPTSSGSISTSGGNLSTASAPSCGDLAPTSSPDLFQVNVTKTTATMYFVPAANATKYFVSYGNGDTTEQHGIEFETGHSSGVLSYTINHLSPGNTYSFKIRGGSGCMPGGWSNVMKVSTSQSSSVATAFYKNFVSKVLSILPRQISSAGSSSAVLGVSNSEAQCIEYVVKPGDNLWSIAASNLGNGSQYQSIMSANSLSSTVLQAGQALKIGCT